ncbi:site-2 protease family protein [Thermodesulfitimonas autotrophica]|uniref:site-2 protease family protein n=1 Tax=Thermodesulfitimonas autotrophica TaxID=1894989 RepID=UPI003FCD017A
MPSAYEIILLTPAVVVGLTVHEFAHGWVADRCGDPTARYAGRLTLNPLKHVDPVGLLLLYLAGFGWARPVPVNPYNFRDRRQGLLLVSLAGPVANLGVALLAAVLLGLSGMGNPTLNDLLRVMIWINVVLAVFNLLPVPPLDGSKVLAALVPGRQEWLYWLEQYGIIILVVLVFSGIIGLLLKVVITPLTGLFLNLAYGLVALTR